VSVYVIPEHQTSYFTCDFIGGKPERRSGCRAGVSVRSEQGALWLDPATADLPDGWIASGGGHLCADHVERVPQDGHVAAVVFSGSAS
jgi:uncharacterized protein YbdZ (MbtH family)